MSEKYVMGSPQWLAAVHAFAVAARPHLQLTRDTTLCEVYKNVPGSIPSRDGTVAFTMRFLRDPQDVAFELKEADDATFKLTIEYSEVLPAGRFIVGGDPERQAELRRMLSGAVKRGTATIEGAPSEELQDLPIHDQIARITA